MKTEFVESVVDCLMKWTGRKYRNCRSLFFTFEDTINYLSLISFLEVSSDVVSSKQSCQRVDLKQS